MSNTFLATKETFVNEIEPSIVSPHEYKYSLVNINDEYLLTTTFYIVPTTSPDKTVFILIHSPSVKVVHIND